MRDRMMSNIEQRNLKSLPPPLEAGADHETDTCPSPDVPLTDVGAEVAVAPNSPTEGHGALPAPPLHVCHPTEDVQFLSPSTKPTFDINSFPSSFNDAESTFGP